MNLYRLYDTPWLDTQLLYHALPRIGREGLILTSPREPYVCVGYFQDAAQEVDLAACDELGIPVFRRETAGGAVYLDGEQLFYQLIIHKDNPLVPPSKAAFYQKFLEAPIEAYRAIGIPAQYKPINDIITSNRKISGNGVAEIGDYIVFVGNLILDFNYDMMVRILNVPDEKFRDKVYKSIRENLTTIRREIADPPGRDFLWNLLAEKFAAILGPLEEGDAIDGEWRAETEKLKAVMTTQEWLLARTHVSDRRDVTIRSGVMMIHDVVKVPGGLIRTTAEIEEGVIRSIMFSGDFFFYPADKIAAMEESLAGCPIAEAKPTLEQFYRDHAIESPGVQPSDFLHAFER